MGWFDGFPGGLHDADRTALFARVGGNADGPPLLLLHGYPQTHAMWHRLAVRLALDHRDRVERLALLDIVPTLTGQALHASHFLAEELPDETAALLSGHLLR